MSTFNLDPRVMHWEFGQDDKGMYLWEARSFDGSVTWPTKRFRTEEECMQHARLHGFQPKEQENV